MRESITTGASRQRLSHSHSLHRQPRIAQTSHTKLSGAPPLDPQTPDASVLAMRIAAYPALWLDLGTGDGRFVRRVAEAQPDTLVIGIDACYANLRTEARRAPANAAFVVADALAMPPEIADALVGKATRVTINFPWGSLLRGLLPGDERLLAPLAAWTAPGARLEARLNGGALAEIGWELAAGVRAARYGLAANGFAIQPPTPLGVDELRACPTTWARRLAFGRDPRAFLLRGVRSSI